MLDFKLYTSIIFIIFSYGLIYAGFSNENFFIDTADFVVMDNFEKIRFLFMSIFISENQKDFVILFGFIFLIILKTISINLKTFLSLFLSYLILSVVFLFFITNELIKINYSFVLGSNIVSMYAFLIAAMMIKRPNLNINLIQLLILFLLLSFVDYKNYSPLIIHVAIFFTIGLIIGFFLRMKYDKQ